MPKNIVQHFRKVKNSHSLIHYSSFNETIIELGVDNRNIYQSEGEAIRYVAGVVLMQHIFNFSISYEERSKYINFLRNFDKQVYENKNTIIPSVEKYNLSGFLYIKDDHKLFFDRFTSNFIEGECLFFAYPFEIEYHYKDKRMDNYRILILEK